MAQVEVAPGESSKVVKATLSEELWDHHSNKSLSNLGTPAPTNTHAHLGGISGRGGPH